MWQLADSSFPTGGFVHSGGLEAAAQAGLIAAIGLEAVIAQALASVAALGLPYVAASLRDGDAFVLLDRRHDAQLSNHVANRASRAQGQALIATAAATFAAPELIALKATLRRDGLPGHLAPCFGRVAASLALDPRSARRLFLFQHLRGLVSSAVRLGVVGPLAAQAMQARLAARGEELAAREPPDVGDAATTAPLVDLVHAQHDRLYSRLFNT